jgi:hypothetical protein
MDSPAGRYRIVERGRKLVTIDTLTGQEVSSLQGSAGVDDAGMKPRSNSLGFELRSSSSSPSAAPAPATAPKPAQTSRPMAQTITTPKREAPKRETGVPRSIPDLEMPSLNGFGRQGRQMLVAVAGVFLALIAISTSMWVLVVLALVFSKEVRGIAFRTLPEKVKSFVNGGL